LSELVAVAFGRVLRRLRKNALMSQEALGIAADLQRKSISWFELGEKQPTITTVFRLAQALQVRPNELVELVEAELKLLR
jgi:transcriptional regulator with XRE-family HTH domain